VGNCGIQNFFHASILNSMAWASVATGGIASGWGGEDSFGQDGKRSSSVLQTIPIAQPAYDGGVKDKHFSGHHHDLSPAIGAAVSSVEQGTFERFDQVVWELEQLNSVDRDIEWTLKAIEETRKEISKADMQIRKKRKEGGKTRARLRRNENPRFLHYLQINRTEKVDRLRGELTETLGKEEKLSGEKHAAEVKLSELEEDLKILRRSAANRDKLAMEKLSTFEAIVASVPATGRLQELNLNIVEQSRNLRMEMKVLAQVDVVVQGLRKSQQLYDEALQLLQRAASLNRSAAVTNIVGLRERAGPELFEKAQQAQRDRFINAAIRPAFAAYQAAIDALQAFPDEACRRCPSLASQIGRAELPNLRGANFGNTVLTGLAFGDFGDALNAGYAGRKIENNLQLVQRSKIIIDEQFGLVVQLRSIFDQNIGKMNKHLRVLEGVKVKEREFIFQRVRVTVLP